MKETLRWGIIGTGAIAGDLALSLRRSTRCRVVSVAGSSADKARAFAARWDLPRAAASVAELLADGDVDAVYVATPHPRHEEHARACIAAGKPTLVEKPFTMDAASTERVLAAARASGVFVMEAFMYRCHPLARSLVERLAAGAIGRILHVRADFGFRKAREPGSRLYDLALGGGAILDVGCYPASFARLIAGVAAGRPFAEPARVQATGLRGPTGVDEQASALLTFPSGVTATISTAIHHALGRSAMIFGEEGHVAIPDPWAPESHRHGTKTSYTIHRDGREPEVVSFDTALDSYALEAELVADALPATQAPWPAMSWDDTLGNMRLLDFWAASLPPT